MTDLRRIIVLVARAGGSSFYGALASMSATGLGFAVVLLAGKSLVGRLAQQRGISMHPSTWAVLVGVVALVSVVAFASMASGGFHRILTEKVVRWCGEQITLLSARSDLIEFDSPTFHDRIGRSRRASDAALQITLAVPRMLASAVTMVGLIVAVALTAPILLPVAVLSGLPMLFAGRALGERMLTFSWGHTPGDRERQHIEEVLTSRDQAAEIRVFGIQSFLTTRWNRLYDDRIADIADIVRGYLRRSMLAAVGVALTLTVLLVSLAVLLSRGDVDLASAVTVGVSVLILSSQSQTIAAGIGALREHSGQMADFLETTKLLETMSVGGVAKPAADALTRLDVDRVTFAYPSADRPALHDVTFTLAAGEMVAIVGANGSGKTTLAKVLCGLYPTRSGEVRWNGRPIRAQEPGSQIGAVFQTFARYWFSAADNIRVGSGSADLQRVRAAATEAGAADFIEELPDGFGTLLAPELEGGVDLSLGQWQRVAIARVLFRDPSLVVLDEPTASLDTQAEAELFATLARLRGGRAVIVISHRFSTVRAADRILVLDHGRLIEQGTHEDLMAMRGAYATMYAQQASAYQDAAALR